MTEKRFTLNINSDWWTISDNTTKKERLYGQDVVELLNELNNENEQLKKGILDCVFDGKSLELFAEEMDLIE